MASFVLETILSRLRAPPDRPAARYAGARAPCAHGWQNGDGRSEVRQNEQNGNGCLVATPKKHLQPHVKKIEAPGAILRFTWASFMICFFTFFWTLGLQNTTNDQTTK